MRHGFTKAAVVATAATLLSFGAGAVTITNDARATIPDFAKRTGHDAALYETRYAATGIVNCDGTYSTGQLTVRGDIVTTAAHAFYDQAGRFRGHPDSCVFSITAGGVHHSVPIVFRTLRVGSKAPYRVSPVYDWAVARLARTVPGAKPYRIGAGAPGAPIVMLAHRHRGWVHDGRKAIENCILRVAHRVDTRNPREIGIDCSAGEGASGSALMLRGATTSIVGIYVGWRSVHPARSGPFSPTHMNFGVALEGPFRTAVVTAVAEARVAERHVPQASAAQTAEQAAPASAPAKVVTVSASADSRSAPQIAGAVSSH